MTLLVEKYSVDTKAAWDSALMKDGEWQRPARNAEQRDAHDALRDARKQAEDDLRAALEAKDAIKIKTVLAALLKSIDAHNKQMKQEIADVKAATN